MFHQARYVICGCILGTYFLCTYSVSFSLCLREHKVANHTSSMNWSLSIKGYSRWDEGGAVDRLIWRWRGRQRRYSGRDCIKQGITQTQLAFRFIFSLWMHEYKVSYYTSVVSWRCLKRLFLKLFCGTWCLLSFFFFPKPKACFCFDLRSEVRTFLLVEGFFLMRFDLTGWGDVCVCGSGGGGGNIYVVESRHVRRFWGRRRQRRRRRRQTLGRVATDVAKTIDDTEFRTTIANYSSSSQYSLSIV